MQRFRLISPIAALAVALCVSACGDDSDGDANDTDGATTQATTAPTTMPGTTTSPGTTTMPDMTTGDTDPGVTSDDPTEGDSEGDSESSSTGEDEFVFADAPESEYTQLDRMGMPAINTAVVTSQDAYNADSPVEDAAGDYVDEITDNIDALHEALDDDLEGAGLTPCATEDCVAQAAPLVVPDTLTLDLTEDAEFPNGRLLTDPVMDVTLAVVLLDLEEEVVTALVGTNPTENDAEFSDEFPYLAAPNQ